MTAFSPQITHNCRDLEHLFNRCFASSENTVLRGGASEPLYAPARGDQPAVIAFTQNYFASALHEVAHWCVAGPQRRAQEDYGYWYAPDGRSADQQAEFERVEARPQALEWIFSRAAAWRFRVSADNLTQNLGPSRAFKLAVANQAIAICHNGLAPRARNFAEALLEYYRPERDRNWLLDEQHFRGESL
ncbi:elongation factor P hydroxylase [Gilvimarinus xylanilyticus]|uniref:Elongation factor P hydroxylase n=1 Tax=Gilvimarinus xylanilyticus TaxID=2944139 RepID=A0A9X2HVF2_9GAMM|nr:elongation factor P hydroxylase [Gilvimarinus xylanilyticus]MCP8899163.1 elongation factor P hydroxylase [Gilvimarinus xylanilyticus]